MYEINIPDDLRSHTTSRVRKPGMKPEHSMKPVCNRSCSRCGHPVSLAMFRLGICNAPNCQNQRIREIQKAAENERTVRDRRLALREYNAGVAAKQVLDSSDCISLTVPSNFRQICNLPEKRQRLFRDHLYRIINDSASYSADGRKEGATLGKIEMSAQTPPSVEMNACTVCRGSCCSSGGTKAYMTPKTIIDLKARRPELRPAQIVQLYMDRIPKRTYSNSCVFHCESGCALTRELRSETCNIFVCGSIQRINNKLKSINAESLVAISAINKNDEVDRCFRVDSHPEELTGDL